MCIHIYIYIYTQRERYIYIYIHVEYVHVHMCVYIYIYNAPGVEEERDGEPCADSQPLADESAYYMLLCIYIVSYPNIPGIII